MFIMSGDSTKEWYRYLFSGSRGWSILNDPPALLKVPVTFTLLSSRIVPPLPKSVMPRLPAPSPLPDAVDRMAHCRPPVLVLVNSIQVPNVLGLCTTKGTYVLLPTIFSLVAEPSGRPEETGVVVPMPTEVSAYGDRPTPKMLPKTKALLSATCALLPIAVALLSVPVEGMARLPRNVLYDPLIFEPSAGCPAPKP